MIDRRQRVLNPRAVVVTCCVTAILIFGIRRLHSHQFDSTRQFLRRSAMQAVDAEHFDTAITLLAQYLNMKPSDTEARQQMSLLLADHVGTQDALETAFRLNEDLLRDNLPQSDLRLQQARLAVRLQRGSDAEAHLSILRRVLPEVSEVWYLSGYVAGIMRRHEEAEQYYRQSIECPNSCPEAFDALVRLRYPAAADVQSAESLLNQMITKNPVAKAWQLRAVWLIEQQRFADALQDLWQAIDLLSEDLNTNSLLVHCLQLEQLRPDRSTIKISFSEETTRVREHLQNLIRKCPRHSQFVADLAALHWMSDSRDDAIDTLRQGLQTLNDSIFLKCTLIEYLLNDNQTVAARREFVAGPAADLKPAVLHYLQGRLLIADQAWIEAVLELERSLAHAGTDIDLRARVQLALAMARRQCGDAVSAVDTYRAVVNDNPQSVNGRLGLAAAWVDAAELDLAIAEYQRVLDVPGVPEWLTCLIIERNLQQPESLRNWKLAEHLVQPQFPRIPDPVQRAMLQTDVLLAQGRITQALDLLEQTALIWPDRIELSRAQRRLNGELKQQVRERLTQLISQQPDKVTAHAALLRTELFSKDTNAAQTWLNSVVNGKVCSSLSEADRLRVVVHALQLATDHERSLKQPHSVKWLESATLDRLAQLVDLSPTDLPTMVQELTLQNNTAAAFSQIQYATADTSGDILALSLLEAARFSFQQDASPADHPKNRSAIVAADAVRQLIAQQPNDPELRCLYAEALLFAEEYDTALETLKQVLSMRPGHAAASARIAWILAVIKQNPNDAREFLPDAESFPSADPLIQQAMARVRMESGHFAESLALLQSSRLFTSSASLLYQAICQSRLDRPDQSKMLVQQLMRIKRRDPLLPAEERLLQSLTDELKDSLADNR